MATEGGGFFNRWSRRKAEEAAREKPQSRPDQGVATPTPADAMPPPPMARVEPNVQTLQGDSPAPGGAGSEEGVPGPTLEDVRLLTPESDFTPFVGRAVAPEVKNAAFKKLFSDPHFNVMDGLDIYIDDYSQPSPLSAELIRQMVSAQFMQLVEQPLPEADKAVDAAATPPGLAAPAVPDPTPSADPASALPAEGLVGSPEMPSPLDRS